MDVQNVLECGYLETASIDSVVAKNCDRRDLKLDFCCHLQCLWSCGVIQDEELENLTFEFNAEISGYNSAKQTTESN